MKNDTGNSGIGIIGDLPRGAHFCQFYRTEEDLVDIVIPYLKAGMGNNEVCIWITSQAPGEVEKAKKALRTAFPDIDIFLQKGQIELISCANWRIKDGVINSQKTLDSLIERVDKALASGYNGLRLVEDMCRLEKESWNDLVNYEKKVDSVIHRYQATVLCTYSLIMCNVAEILDIVANHQFALAKKEGKWELVKDSGLKNDTECRRAKQVIQESEENDRRVFEAMQEAFFIADIITDDSGKPVDYRIIEANQALETQTGVPLEKFIGNTALGMYPGLDPFWVQIYGCVALTGRPVRFTHYADVQGRHYEVSAYQIRPGRFAAIFLDITDRKRTEEALRASESRFRSLYENSLDGIMLTRPDGTVFSANPQARFLFGMTEEEIIQAGREGMVVKDEKLAAALEERELTGRMKAELTCRRKDGSTFVCDTTSNLFTDADGSIKTSMIIRDITDRKQAEEALRESQERYRMLFTNMTDGFGLVEVIYSRNGKPYDYRYLEVNPAFEISLGVKKEQLLGRTMLEVFPNVSPIAIEKYGEVALSGNPVHFEIFSQIKRKYLDIYVFRPEKGRLALILRDITERKQMEKGLQESEEKYRNIVETASEGVWIADSEARAIYVNKRIAEMLGYTPDEMIGRYAWDFADEEGKQEIKEKIEKRRLGIDERYEFKFIRKDGLPLWTIVSSKSLFDKAGKFTGSISMFTDINERKEAEAKLKETLDNLENLVKERTDELEKAYNLLKKSEKSLAEAQKMAHVGNWEWDIEADKAYWSDELYRIFGRSPQEPAPPYNEYLNYLHPDDRDYFDNATKEAINGKPYSINYRIIRANGEEGTVHMQSQIILDEKNTPIRIKGIIQDITESELAQQKIKESEERYRSFIENFKGIAFQANENFNPVFLHGTVEEITGYSEDEFMTKHRWKDIIHPEDLPNIYKEEKKVRNSPYKTDGEVDFRIIRRDGKTKWVHEIYQKIPGKNGNPDKYQGAIYDITERKEAEEALANLEKIRIKEIHHRIKNNLQVISSLLDLQAETFSHLEVCKTPEVVEAFMESQNRVISMALIHEELYKGDKLDTLDFAAYLRKLTEDLFGSYNPGNKDIGFKLNLEQVYLGMDTAIPLGIIVNELVSNSFKHAFPDRKEGEIRLNLRRTETSAAVLIDIPGPGNDCAEEKVFDYILEVSDNGKGIPGEIDLENTESLGLQLVDILVKQIDGCIKLERDQGTKFTIWFNNIEI